MSDFEQLVRASRLYYELGETQNAIAEQLGVTRPQVSRLLKRARAEGIVEIRIIDRTTVDEPGRATPCWRRFGLDAVHLAPTIAGPEDLTRRMVGRLAAEVLRAALRPGAIVGIGDGASVAATAAALEEAATPVAVTVVPLCGGYWSTGPEREPYRRVADALDGQARGLMAPGLVDDAGTRKALVAHAGVRAIVDLWDRLDIALFGIGGPSWTSSVVGEGVAAAARQGGRRGRGPGRPVRPRRPVRLPGASRAGHRARRATVASHPGRRSAWRRARARSGRSSAPCEPASSARW